MRILQLIDSLEAGGAERMAVNIANALLLQEGFKSYLCATRKEGMLKTSLKTDVGYLYLNKRSTFDISAIQKLKQFVKKYQIDVIHAHSTSYFMATLVKWRYPKVRVVWHDHYGKSEFLTQRKLKILKFCSSYFSYVICVTDALKNWSITHLKTQNVTYLPNFAIQNSMKVSTVLKGTKRKRILHLANLRPQKDHITLLEAFKKVTEKHKDFTLHCVGKNFEDAYAAKVFKHAKELHLNEDVFFYGSKKDISNILGQSDICVLSSKSEGLPIALLEYGLASKPTIVTNVGNCSQVIENNVNGLIVEKESPALLSKGMLYLIEHKDAAVKYGNLLKKKVMQDFSAESYIEQLIAIYNSVISE